MIEIFLKSMTIIPPLGAILSSLLIARKLGIDKNHTVSVLAARDKNTARALSWTVFVCGSLYYLAIFFLIGPKFDLPYMTMLIIFAVIGLLVLSIFPADSRRPRFYALHSAAGWVLIAIMYALATMIWLSPYSQTSDVGVLAGWYVALSAIAGIGLVLFKRLRKEQLFFEVVYVAGFYVIIVAAAFL